LNTEIEKFQHALSSFAEEALRWPQLISDKESKTKYLNTVNEELQNIRTELQYVEQKRAASKDMEKQRQVTLLNEEITAAEEKLKKLPTVTDKEITEINQLQKEALRSQALIDGQKLLLKIHPSVSGSIEVIQSRDKKEKIEFESGNSKIIHINGLAEWEWNDIIFTVQSANEDIETLNSQLEKIQETINTFLNTYNQRSIEDLIIITETRKKIDSIIEEKKANLKQLLGDDTKESLSERCKHTKNFPDTRDYQTIQKLKEDKIKESSVLQTELAKIEEELLTLEKKHISLSNLDQRRVKGLFEIKQKEDNLKLLSPLPHQYESEEAFNLIYKKFEEEKKGLVNQKHILELELKDLKQPILSLQEAAEQKVIADNKFQRLLKEGNAYIRIQEVLNQIINEADGNAFMPLHKRTEYYLNKLSNGRFQEIPFDATQPQELKGSDIRLPVTLLSKGTKDLLALAFRLAAADIFLENGTGFIVMDDPLVDMDLQRREAASEVLRTFAQKQQTILFTCH
jgi:DNA repair exonuclease SbcCD ATPase subunit